MAELTGYKQVSLKELMSIAGEDKAKAILSSFSCPLNPDVEEFLREKAILFTKQGLAAVHLVFTSHQGKVTLIGYYALTTKTVIIKKKNLNSLWRRRLNKFAKYDEELEHYYIALPLIGQLGKNFANGYNKLITGDELLKMACDMIKESQLILGGKMAFLECEDLPCLVTFYRENGFYPFDHRNLDRDELGTAKTAYLVQMMCYFNE